jgi:Flp pilus assembly protein TadB
MTVVALLSAGAGLGLALLAVWLVPPVPALGTQLARLTAPAGSTNRGSLLAPIIRLLRSADLPTRSISRDLAVLERPVQDHLAEKATLALAGLLTPTLGALAATALGLAVGTRIPAIAAIACAATGFWIPDHRVHRHATRRRRDFRHALSAFLDLVVISLAGGAGVDSALTDAATTGHGQAFTQIRRALAAAHLTRTTPWDALRDLGRAIDIPELTELAASISLAGTEGATIRQSLHAKASALRARQLTDGESDASADTERMSIPVMALFFGFLCFITYPAMTQVLTGF